MLIVMKPTASTEEIAAVVEQVAAIAGKRIGAVV